MKNLILSSLILLAGCIELDSAKTSADSAQESTSASSLGESARSTIIPHVAAIADQFVAHGTGEDLAFTIPIANQDSLNGIIHWTKDYGPDGVKVHPESGLVTWDIFGLLNHQCFLG